VSTESTASSSVGVERAPAGWDSCRVASAGDVLENPATGERVVFRRTAAETGGEALEYELRFRPQGFLVREHLHPAQSERHEVLEGRLGLHLDGEDRVLEPGDGVIVPAAAPHRLFPVGDEPVHALFELRPALRTEELLETFVRLAQEGKIDRKGNPKPLELALLARAFEAEGYATKPPLAVQHVLLAPLAWLAKLLGRKIE
jgi:mannose-6-phosphate isomerase-like protein (cupin superfamily)